MKENWNLYSFAASIVCIALFLIAATSEWIRHFFLSQFTIHPLTVVLVPTVLCFFSSLLGMKEATNAISSIRSFMSIGISFI
ncbi:hypothetical protein [Lysinibacillus sp. 54212]|uniref:hypothetical protein n=1 Tax=Lysinibacillus sp. 54212 TaxID=3119829 RepID=UPI002FC6A65F